MLRTLALVTYLGLLEFGDGDYAWNRLLDHISMIVSSAGERAGFVGLTFFRETPFAPARLSLALVKRFFGLAEVGFAALPRADLEVFRTLPRAIDFLFLTAARLFRTAMIAACSDGHLKECRISASTDSHIIDVGAPNCRALPRPWST